MAMSFRSNTRLFLLYMDEFNTTTLSIKVIDAILNSWALDRKAL
jgi:hypothetical protein